MRGGAHLRPTTLPLPPLLSPQGLHGLDLQAAGPQRGAPASQYRDLRRLPKGKPSPERRLWGHCWLSHTKGELFPEGGVGLESSRGGSQRSDQVLSAVSIHTALQAAPLALTPGVLERTVGWRLRADWSQTAEVPTWLC